MNKSFASTPHRAVKTIASTPSPKGIPGNSNKAKASPAKPAPLRSGCASCGKRR